MESNGIFYEKIIPQNWFSDYIGCIWHLENRSGHGMETEILPDGFFDLLFTADSGGFRAFLVGLQTKPVRYFVPKNCRSFSVSFRLPAAWLFAEFSLAKLINGKQEINTDLFKIALSDFKDLELFSKKIYLESEKIFSENQDLSFVKLCREIYGTQGEKTVSYYSDVSGISARTLNRMFQKKFGLNMKTFCRILRFRSTFRDLHYSNYAVEADFADQSHFIKEVKTFSGALPRELSSNKNDRFLQLSTLRD